MQIRRSSFRPRLILPSLQASPCKFIVHIPRPTTESPDLGDCGGSHSRFCHLCTLHRADFRFQISDSGFSSSTPEARHWSLQISPCSFTLHGFGTGERELSRIESADSPCRFKLQSFGTKEGRKDRASYIHTLSRFKIEISTWVMYSPVPDGCRNSTFYGSYRVPFCRTLFCNRFC